MVNDLTPANDNLQMVVYQKFQKVELFYVSIYLWHCVGLSRIDIPTWCWRIEPFILRRKYSEDFALDLLVRSYEWFGTLSENQKKFLRQLWEESTPQLVA